MIRVTVDPDIEPKLGPKGVSKLMTVTAFDEYTNAHLGAKIAKIIRDVIVSSTKERECKLVHADAVSDYTFYFTGNGEQFETNEELRRMVHDQVKKKIEILLIDVLHNPVYLRKLVDKLCWENSDNPVYQQLESLPDKMKYRVSDYYVGSIIVVEQGVKYRYIEGGVQGYFYDRIMPDYKPNTIIDVDHRRLIKIKS